MKYLRKFKLVNEWVNFPEPISKVFKLSKDDFTNIFQELLDEIGYNCRILTLNNDRFFVSLEPNNGDQESLSRDMRNKLHDDCEKDFQRLLTMTDMIGEIDDRLGDFGLMLGGPTGPLHAGTKQTISFVISKIGPQPKAVKDVDHRYHR